MAKESYITGLDIGTSHIRAVQGKVKPDGLSVQIIGAAEVPSAGLRKGVVVDIEEAVSCISTALERVERMTGVPVDSANISVSGSHVTSQNSHGVIAVSRADGEITEADIVRVVDASQAISIPSNREVLHVFPKSFTLDGQSGIKDPAGMSGIRLEVESIIVQAGSPFIKNLSRCVMQAGLEINELVLGVLAASESVLSKRQKDLGVCVVDLGAGTTAVSVYEEGDLMHTSIIPIGSQHMTNDIAIGLRTSIETAEKVKLLYGHCDIKAIDKNEEIFLNQIDQSEQQTTLRGLVVEIIEARLEEIFDRVIAELKRINRDGKLPAGIVLTGGGSHLPGVVDFAKKHLRLPSALGVSQNVETVIDRVSEPAFATAVGLVLWGQKYGTVSSGRLENSLGAFLKNPALEKAKRWLKSLLP
ncbi:MAG: cell division protein FtsA [Candidatus Doudnabacteria bacterium]|nr:cell division protein FtsA [Candidatus Doudnabacteria bacterium]